MKSKGNSVPQAPAMSVVTEAPDIPFDAEPASGPQEDDGFDSVPAAGEKLRFSGDWSCAHCGASITSLPFTPRDTNNLKCIDCFKKSKA
jgi:CxxC-x17-CxxC domain-containing protein